MRFHRNIKMLRNQVDAAPFVTVAFLVMMFVLLGWLLYTPGFHVRLPVVEDLPGTDHPTVSVTVDAAGRIFFENQLMASEQELADHLRTAVTNAPEPLTLIVQADREVTYDNLAHIISIARAANIQEALLATKPRLFQTPGAPTP